MRFGIREFLFMLVLLSVPVAAFWFVFKPRNAEILQARDEIAAKREKLDRLRDVTARIDDLNEAIRVGNEAIGLIVEKLPDEQNVDDVLRQASQIAREHGLHLKSVEPELKVPAAQYMELPIKVELAGDFDGFYELLLDLEQMPRLTRIKNLSMERVNDREGDMTASFTLSVYFQPKSASNQNLAGVSR